MALDLDKTRISPEDKQEIKDKSPDVLPLNPTSQGWTGQAIRRQLTRYVTDEQASVLALMEEKFDQVSNYLGTLESLAGGGLDIMPVVYDEAIEVGDLLQFAGTVGGSGKLKVKKTRNTGEDSIQVHPEYMVGIALESGNQNAQKEIIIGGVYIGLDTSGYIEGAILYPDPSNNGGLTNTEPDAPLNRTKVAITIYSHQNNGIIIYRPTFFPDMAHIQDVDITGVSDGDVMKYESSTKTFKPGKAQGIFYNDDLPEVEQRYVNLTFFDVGE
jgi:hypothetical protein